MCFLDAQGKSLETPIRNALISTSSTLAIMLPGSYSAMKVAKGLGELPPEKFHSSILYNAREFPFAKII